MENFSRFEWTKAVWLCEQFYLLSKITFLSLLRNRTHVFCAQRVSESKECCWPTSSTTAQNSEHTLTDWSGTNVIISSNTSYSPTSSTAVQNSEHTLTDWSGTNVIISSNTSYSPTSSTAVQNSEHTLTDWPGISVSISSNTGYWLTFSTTAQNSQQHELLTHVFNNNLQWSGISISI